jgi:hypothetical protein
MRTFGNSIYVVRWCEVMFTEIKVPWAPVIAGITYNLGHLWSRGSRFAPVRLLSGELVGPICKSVVDLGWTKKFVAIA